MLLSISLMTISILSLSINAQTMVNGSAVQPHVVGRVEIRMLWKGGLGWERSCLEEWSN